MLIEEIYILQNSIIFLFTKINRYAEQRYNIVSAQ